jgi:hypothetical protein
MALDLSSKNGDRALLTTDEDADNHYKKRRTDRQQSNCYQYEEGRTKGDFPAKDCHTVLPLEGRGVSCTIAGDDHCLKIVTRKKKIAGEDYFDPGHLNIPRRHLLGFVVVLAKFLAIFCTKNAAPVAQCVSALGRRRGARHHTDDTSRSGSQEPIDQAGAGAEADSEDEENSTPTSTSERGEDLVEVIVPDSNGYRIVLSLCWPDPDPAKELPMRVVCERQYLPSKITASARPPLAPWQDLNVWAAAQGSRVVLQHFVDVESFLLATCQVGQHVNLLGSTSTEVGYLYILYIF